MAIPKKTNRSQVRSPKKDKKTLNLMDSEYRQGIKSKAQTEKKRQNNLITKTKPKIDKQYFPEAPDYIKENESMIEEWDRQVEILKERGNISPAFFQPLIRYCHLVYEINEMERCVLQEGTYFYKEDKYGNRTIEPNRLFVALPGLRTCLLSYCKQFGFTPISQIVVSPEDSKPNNEVKSMDEKFGVNQIPQTLKFVDYDVNVS